MDNIDYKILRCLKDNARLESSGVIKRYTIEVDQKKLGNEMVAIMEVRLKHPKYYDEFAQLIQTNDSIVACFYMTGDFDFILKIVTDSAAGLDEVYRFVKGYEGVSATNSEGMSPFWIPASKCWRRKRAFR